MLSKCLIKHSTSSLSLQITGFCGHQQNLISEYAKLTFCIRPGSNN